MGSDCHRARSLLRLGKSRTFNFVRGPGGFNACKFQIGIPLPSKRTVRRNKPGYTMASGIIKNLLVSILRIADSQNTCCYVNSSTVKAIAISLTRDGLGFKPGLEFDERKKVLVGSPNKIDMDYIRKNPVPNPSQPKQGMIKDADISVVATIDRKINPPVGVYHEAADQSGKEVLAEVEEIAGHLQTSLACLEA